jgi:hypothetical protein
VTQHATARRRIVGAAAAALTLAGLLAGCSTRPGAAAVVDGRTIRTSDLVAVVADLKPALGDVSAAQVLNILIEEPMLVQLAADHGQGVSAADAKSTLDAFFTSAKVTPPAGYSAATLQVGLHQAANAKLRADTTDTTLSQDYTDRLAKLAVTVNPRFGTWDQGQLGAAAAPSWVVAQK